MIIQITQILGGVLLMLLIVNLNAEEAKKAVSGGQHVYQTMQTHK